MRNTPWPLPPQLAPALLLHKHIAAALRAAEERT